MPFFVFPPNRDIAARNVLTSKFSNNAGSGLKGFFWVDFANSEIIYDHGAIQWVSESEARECADMLHTLRQYKQRHKLESPASTQGEAGIECHGY